MIRRTESLIVLIIITFTFLIYKLICITCVDSEIYTNKVANQNYEVVSLNSGRGIIYDINNEPLTDTESKNILVLDKMDYLQSEEIKQIFIELAEQEGNFQNKILDQVKEEIDDISSILMKIEVSNISKEIEEKLNEHSIIVQQKYERYCDDNLLAHVIGYVHQSENNGVTGIEKEYDDVLKKSNEDYISVFKAGQSGNLNNKYISSLKGTLEIVEQNEEDKHIRVTIDKDIQEIIEDTMDDKKNSVVIVSQVEDGKISAIASRPNYDPNEPPFEGDKGLNGSSFNRAIQGVYEPGSVFKIVVLYGALKENIIDENYIFNCEGKVMSDSGVEQIHCFGNKAHGIQTLEDCFANSCNCAFYDIAKQLGTDKIIESAKALHLDEVVGIGLDEINKDLPEDESIRNLAIGQGKLLLTPLQINQLTQIIANNGTYEPLYIYDSIIDSDKNIVTKLENTKTEEIINPYVITKIKEMMKSVVEYGTGKELNDLYNGCGVKTGSAEVSNGKTNGWVTGFYPSENPKYAITVLVENVSSSSDVIPIFKEICQKLK